MGSYQITPTEDAWGRIEDRLRPTGNFTKTLIFKIAAILIILFGVVLTVTNINLDNGIEPLAINVDGPFVISENSLKISQLQGHISHEIIPVETEESSKNIQPSIQIAIVSIDKIPVLNVTKKSFENVNLSIPELIEADFNQPTFTKIKIEYYADATDTADPASKGKLGKFLKQAWNTTPADFLADIRDAKDNFINETLNLD